MLSHLSQLKGKLVTVIIVMVLLVMTITVIQVHKSNSISNISTELSETTSPIIIKSFELQLAVLQVQQWLTDISATRGQDGLNDGFDEAAKYAAQALQLMQELSELNPEHKSLYQGMPQKFNAYYRVGQKMANAYIEGGAPQGK